jgi:hypothetical protein
LTVTGPVLDPDLPTVDPMSRRASRIAAQAQRRVQRRRVRNVVAILLLVVLSTTVWSYYRALSAAGTDPWSARSVEWLRDNGMDAVVNWVEHWWYSNHPPPVGGTPAHGIPHESGPNGEAIGKRSGRAAPVPVVAHLAPPLAMKPLVTTPLPGEGVWQPTGRTVAGLPAVYTAFFRPDAVHTSLIAGAMWLDTKLLKASFVAGLREPGAAQPWGAQVPVALRPGLVAAFNSGFKIDAARGGVYVDGQVVHPLVQGAASLVIDTHGHATVGTWGRDVNMSSSVAAVRQNLVLILDHGQPAPGLPANTNGAWGDTLGNQVFVWRSGVGVDRNGALIYVAGPGLSAVTLAVLLKRAGCVRAMELDINRNWVSAYTYRQLDPANPASVDGVKLLSDMQRSTDRYLVPGERDFFAFFAAR